MTRRPEQRQCLLGMAERLPVAATQPRHLGAGQVGACLSHPVTEHAIQPERVPKLGVRLVVKAEPVAGEPAVAM
jgi:hypothetical protein